MEKAIPVPGQGAICWGAYSSRFNSAHVIDVMFPNLTVLDPSTGAVIGSVRYEPVSVCKAVEGFIARRMLGSADPGRPYAVLTHRPSQEKNTTLQKRNPKDRLNSYKPHLKGKREVAHPMRTFLGLHEQPRRSAEVKDLQSILRENQSLKIPHHC